MSQITEEEFSEIVELYFIDRIFTISKISEYKKIKTPDYNIARIPRKLTYLGELKAPELHLNQNTNLYMHLTKIRKLRQSFIKKAAEQFESIDESRIKPRLLIFTSSHFQFHGKNLLEAIHGFIPGLADFRKDKIVEETQVYINKIDLFIWLQINPETKKPYQATYIINSTSKFMLEISNITKELNAKPLSTMDQLFKI